VNSTTGQVRTHTDFTAYREADDDLNARLRAGDDGARIEVVKPSTLEVDGEVHCYFNDPAIYERMVGGIGAPWPMNADPFGHGFEPGGSPVPVDVPMIDGVPLAIGDRVLLKGHPSWLTRTWRRLWRLPPDGPNGVYTVTGGTLPEGLDTGQDYYVLNVSSHRFKLRRSRWWQWKWWRLLLGVGLVAAYLLAAANVAHGQGRLDPLTWMVLQEAGNEPLHGQIAVAAVALDRVAADPWPGHLEDVLFQPSQFAGMTAPLRHYSPQQVRQAQRAIVLAGAGMRPCGEGVFWFDNIEAFGVPGWAGPSLRRCPIGNHVFFSILGPLLWGGRPWEDWGQ
jgi:hypothetical protein